MSALILAETQKNGFLQYIQNNILKSNWFAAILIAVGGILLIHLIMKLVTKALEKSKLEKAAHSLIKSVLKILLYGELLLIIASKLKIDMTGIIALTSVLTLAISLALQNALGNLISGFSLLYTKPFKSGDFVEIAGQSGTIQEIGLTYTKLITPDNKEICVPNSSVAAAQIINFTATGKRRADIEVSASYDAPVSVVLDALKEAAGAVPTVLTDPAVFTGVQEYGDNAIVYLLQVWSNTEDFLPTKYAVNRKIKDVFDREGIEMTYPHLNVHMDSK